MPASPPTTGGLLNVREVARLLRVGVRSVWRLTAQGIIPTPVHLTRRTTRWRLEEINALIASGGLEKARQHERRPNACDLPAG